MKKLLVDTSIWIEYFKGDKQIYDIIHGKSGYAVYITEPIITELILGMKTQKEMHKFTMCMNAIPSLETCNEGWVAAGKLGNRLRAAGTTVALADLLIYCMAKKHDCSIFSLDRHFRIIKEKTQDDIEILYNAIKLLP